MGINELVGWASNTRRLIVYDVDIKAAHSTAGAVCNAPLNFISTTVEYDGVVGRRSIVVKWPGWVVLIVYRTVPEFKGGSSTNTGGGRQR